MEYFLQLFGDLSIGLGVVVICAAVFLAACYKKVETYFSEKAVQEAENNKRINHVIEQAEKYPEWRQQSVNAQERIGGSIEGLEKKIDDITNSVEDLKKSSCEGKALTWRYRILRFSDEILHDEKHSKEHFDQILEDITNYERYCKEHPEFPNNKAEFAIKNIKRIYYMCVNEGTFL